MKKIIFDDVSLSFADKKIFSHCNVELKAGRVIGIVGRNGSGKSTFLKLAGKIIKPDSGTVNIFDGTVAAITPEMKLYDELTTIENLKFFTALRGKIFTEEEAIKLCGSVGLGVDGLKKVRVGHFSTGMRQRLKFAVLIGVDANIWLLDEPTANLDEEGRKIFHDKIKTAAQFGRVILLATNDKFDMDICDEIIKLPIG